MEYVFGIFDFGEIRICETGRSAQAKCFTKHPPNILSIMFSIFVHIHPHKNFITYAYNLAQ